MAALSALRTSDAARVDGKNADFAVISFSRFASAAWFGACGMLVVAARRKSPKQPFNNADVARAETSLSPQPDQTFGWRQTVTMRPRYGRSSRSLLALRLIAVLQLDYPGRGLL